MYKTSVYDSLTAMFELEKYMNMYWFVCFCGSSDNCKVVRNLYQHRNAWNGQILVTFYHHYMIFSCKYHDDWRYQEGKLNKSDESTSYAWSHAAEIHTSPFKIASRLPWPFGQDSGAPPTELGWASNVFVIVVLCINVYVKQYYNIHIDIHLNNQLMNIKISKFNFKFLLLYLIIICQFGY